MQLASLKIVSDNKTDKMLSCGDMDVANNQFFTIKCSLCHSSQRLLEQNSSPRRRQFLLKRGERIYFGYGVDHFIDA
jgi:hypothetical protein